MNQQNEHQRSGADAAELPISRREALHSGSRLTLGLAALSLPIGLAATVRKAYGNHLPPAVVEVLNFALQLEYLEADFYQRGLDSGVIPGRHRGLFRVIRDHEVEHVQFLLDVLGDAAVSRPEFDFSVGGLNPFGNFEQFTLLAQGFEDTGVRAYKGQAGALLPSDIYLTAALTIHSVEARHAARVRRLRDLEGWIPFDGANTPLPPIYQGEGNTVIAGLDVATLPLMQEYGISLEQITESFDEPLTMEQVLQVAGLFIVP